MTDYILVETRAQANRVRLRTMLPLTNLLEVATMLEEGELTLLKAAKLIRSRVSMIQRELDTLPSN